ncbi:hypothetical protein [[Phormidium] sp. ETS-05]|nr:hypothetical protein [[Phormidium] sp. ETS-05]
MTFPRGSPDSPYHQCYDGKREKQRVKKKEKGLHERTGKVDIF